METTSASPQGTALASGRPRLLVVEDEFLIRMMLCDELRDAGFDVIEAFNADEAVAILGSLTPDLIISDVRMPGSIDGIGLLAVVRNAFPTLPVIITSAHLGPSLAIGDGATHFVAKPYAFEKVLKVVQEELGKCR